MRKNSIEKRKLRRYWIDNTRRYELFKEKNAISDEWMAKRFPFPPKVQTQNNKDFQE